MTLRKWHKREARWNKSTLSGMHSSRAPKREITSIIQIDFKKETNPCSSTNARGLEGERLFFCLVHFYQKLSARKEKQMNNEEERGRGRKTKREKERKGTMRRNKEDEERER